MTIRHASIPTVVSDYVTRFVDPYADNHPIIVGKFIPERGWVSTAGFRKRVSVTWVRKLRSEEGVTHVALKVAPNRIADFSVTEIIRGGR